MVILSKLAVKLMMVGLIMCHESLVLRFVCTVIVSEEK